ncbi:MAG TPA: hypothetical protein VIN02_04900 [Sulfurovum sp.]
MKILTLFTVILLLAGCSGEQISHNITKTQITMSGDKPPAKYRVANLQTMKDYTFETKDFSFKLPTAIQIDFTKMGGWWGASHRDGKTITSHLHPVYHIVISTYGKVSDYSERDRAIDTHNVPYMKARFHKYNPDTKISIQNYGKENYDCIIIEDNNYNKWDKKEITYSCYKFNPSKTKSKSVSITLTYNKPKDPTLAKEYTYKDLQNRAKRMLDSLYIKDSW